MLFVIIHFSFFSQILFELVFLIVFFVCVYILQDISSVDFACTESCICKDSDRNTYVLGLSCLFHRLYFAFIHTSSRSLEYCTFRSNVRGNLEFDYLRYFIWYDQVHSRKRRTNRANETVDTRYLASHACIASF